MAMMDGFNPDDVVKNVARSMGAKLFDVDQRRSSAEETHATEYPWFIEHLEVRNENGQYLGTLTVRTLIPEKPMDIANQSYLTGLLDVDDERVKRNEN